MSRYRIREVRGFWWLLDGRHDGVVSRLEKYGTEQEAQQAKSELEAEDALYGEGWEEVE